MTFNTLDFLGFFAITLLLYFIFPLKLRNLLLLVSSYVFYAVYSAKLTIYLVFTTLFAYLFGLVIERVNNKKAAKLWMIVGISIYVTILAFYKYFNFLSGIVSSVIGVEEFELHLLVPLGISFITFTVIAYLVDVYRGEIHAERNFLNFALFVAFFPKVVQGPIERASDIIPQFEKEHRFELARFREGMIMALYGLFLKMVVADTCAIIVNTVYGSIEEYSGAAVLLAAFIFSFQIYFDFAGYSYTAIGIARVLGFDFGTNFCQPYMSLSVSEFWRRWHCSLNRWLTNYIYIPLGGSRCSKQRHRFNVLVTFGISGLWHGADWGYIVWGLLNGVFVNIENAFKNKDKSGLNTLLVKELKRIYTFFLITITWIFFRTEKLSMAQNVFKRIFTDFRLMDLLRYTLGQLKAGPGNQLFGIDAFFGIVPFIICFAIAIIVDVLAYHKGQNLLSDISEGPRWRRWAISYCMIFAIIIWGIYGYGYSASAFIYAGF